MVGVGRKKEKKWRENCWRSSPLLSFPLTQQSSLFSISSFPSTFIPPNLQLQLALHYSLRPQQHAHQNNHPNNQQTLSFKPAPSPPLKPQPLTMPDDPTTEQNFELDEPRHPCSNCGTFGAKLLCGRCRLSHYCDVTCQKRDWKHFHKRLVCEGAPEREAPVDGETPLLDGVEGGGGKGAIEDGDARVKIDWQKERLLEVMPKLAEMPGSLTAAAEKNYMKAALSVDSAVLDKDWWIPATRDRPARALHFFIDAFRLRVEDARLAAGESRGYYKEAEGEEGAAVAGLRGFLEKAKAEHSLAENRVILPDFWSASLDAQLLLLAAAPSSDYTVKLPAEQEAVGRQWGEERVRVMRALADRIEGRVVVK